MDVAAKGRSANQWLLEQLAGALAKQMARIARRSLRIQSLPLFSLDKPWQSVCDDSGALSLRFFEPRYVELARRVLPPGGDGNFGYAEKYPPRAGKSGVLARVEQHKWEGDDVPGQDPATATAVRLSARAAKRFRILSVRAQEVEPSKPPLFLAHVQLLHNRDTARGAGVEAWNYWTSRARSSSAGRLEQPTAESSEQIRARSVTNGTALVAKLGAPVFESCESWHVVAQVPDGVAVVAGGPPRMVEGYLMVPIVPSGAVELTLFRELNPGNVEDCVPTEEDLRAALLNMAAPEALQPEPTDARGRKSSRRHSRGAAK